jgi:hypothetical protein
VRRPRHVPEAGEQTPVAGSVAPAGSVVELDPGGAPLGSPGYPVDAEPAIVPDLRGRTLEDALGWAADRDLLWEVRRAAALPPTAAASLYQAYRVRGQSPGPGEMIDASAGDELSLEVEPAVP